MKQKTHVLVVHCVDTEGPIGGNVRRRPDGSKEFYDTWSDIKRSLSQITSTAWRKDHTDSFGNLYRYNWFIMDFTGFRTNPKKRIARYNDTYDHIKKLDTNIDAFYWHYHHLPKDGRGDQWSSRWDSSKEYENILLHWLIDREDWPEVYRAGGTIEDNQQSLWLEDRIMVDFSNRASNRSFKTSKINDFNWYGAPAKWGYYHPSRQNVFTKGTMRRYIVRCVDLWSRIHALTPNEVEDAFVQAKRSSSPVILSFFSHDHRDMREETQFAISLIRMVSERYRIPWRSCNAIEALQISAHVTPKHIHSTIRRKRNDILIKLSAPIFQKHLHVAAKAGKNYEWLNTNKLSTLLYDVEIPKNAHKVVLGGTSLSGNKFIKVIK